VPRKQQKNQVNFKKSRVLCYLRIFMFSFLIYFVCAVATKSKVCTKAPDYLEMEKKLMRSANTDEVFNSCELHGEIFNHVNISTAMFRIAKELGSFSENRTKGHMGLTIRQEKVCRMIFQRAVSIADQFEPHSISILVWALAGLNIPLQELKSEFSVFLKRAAMIIEDFKPLNLADFLWGLAMLELPPEVTLARAISNQAVKLMDSFNPQSISKLVWGFAKLQLEFGAELVKAAARRAVETMNEFRPTNMSQLMWAFAKLEIFPGVELAQAVLKRVKSTLDVFLRQTQCSANFLWALDKLGIDLDPQLADALSGRQRPLQTRIKRRSRSRSAERSSKLAPSRIVVGPSSDRLQEKSCHISSQNHPRARVQIDAPSDWSSVKHDDYNRKRGPEFGVCQTDDIDHRALKKPTGPSRAEFSHGTGERFQEMVLKPMLHKGSSRKEAWLNDAGEYLRLLYVEYRMNPFVHLPGSR
jgi:hypothetical protein